MLKRSIFDVLLAALFLVVAGCNEPVEPKPSRAAIEPQVKYEPELWVVGGMGSFEAKPNQLYIANELRKKISGVRPDVCITSGTREKGPNSITWNLVNTPAWLDADAQKQANWALRMFVNPRKGKGHFIKSSGKTRIVVILVAPCTQTLPPKSNDKVELEIYLLRDPKDPVPNQSFAAPVDQKFYSQFGELRMIESRPDIRKGLLVKKPGGIQGAHHFSGYWYRDLPVLESKNGRWVKTGEKFDIIELLDKALHDPSVDYVMIGHSQGANIIMKILHQGMAEQEAGE